MSELKSDPSTTMPIEKWLESIGVGAEGDSHRGGGGGGGGGSSSSGSGDSSEGSGGEGRSEDKEKRRNELALQALHERFPTAEVRYSVCTGAGILHARALSAHPAQPVRQRLERQRAPGVCVSPAVVEEGRLPPCMCPLLTPVHHSARPDQLPHATVRKLRGLPAQRGRRGRGGTAGETTALRAHGATDGAPPPRVRTGAPPRPAHPVPPTPSCCPQQSQPLIPSSLCRWAAQARSDAAAAVAEHRCCGCCHRPRPRHPAANGH
jgi:hypothetical protein